MPSRAEIRGGLEVTLRGVSLIILAWMLWSSLDRESAATVVEARSGNLDAAIRDWTSAGLAPDRIVVELDSTPSRLQRDWLRALSRSGSALSWSGDIAPIAVSAQRIAAPRGGMVVLAATDGAQPLQLFDDVGALDTATTRNGGATFRVPAATGFIGARSAGNVARAAQPDSVRIRRLLVLGSAGWESKFVTAALEEDGWSVDAAMSVAPGVTVTQGATAPIDTSRYSAVIALDEAAAARAPEIGRYVSSGGGLVLAGSASRSAGFAALRAATPGRLEAPAALSSEAPATLASLGFLPASLLKGDAIPLGRSGASTVLAARRHGGGRVLQQGYLDTWRWRMSGGDESLDDHREWWSRAVASVAYAPAVRSTAENLGESADNAPTAGVIDALGPTSSRVGPSLASAAASISLWWLFAALALCLLGEWASRRLRGMR
jgi:hypothetical protein